MTKSLFTPTEVDIDKAYKKLKSFKSKQALKSHANQTGHYATTDYDLDNTDSYTKVQKVIFNQAQKYIVTKAEQKSTQMERDEKLKNAMQHYWLDSLLNGDAFQFFIISVVLVQCILNTLRIDPEFVTGIKERTGVNIVETVDFVFLGIFITESVARLFIGLSSFWNNKMNIFMAVIWMVQVICIGLGVYDRGYVVSTFRVFRILTPFKHRRLFPLFSGVRSILATLQDSSLDIISITMVVIVATFFWAAIGVVLFGEKVPLDFGTIWDSFFSCFVGITQIGWIDTMNEISNHGMFMQGLLFYATYFLLVVYIISKNIVAVVVGNLENFHKRLAETKKKRNRKLKSTKAILKGQSVRQFTSIPPKDSPNWKGQIPFEVPNFDLISKEKLEKYFAILAIMEGNLGEYVELVEQLKAIQAEVKELNNALRESPEGNGSRDEVLTGRVSRYEDNVADVLVRNRSVLKTKPLI